jgi:hypothetical protein
MQGDEQCHCLSFLSSHILQSFPNVLDNSDSESTDSCNVETNEHDTITLQQADVALAG